jgi:hypothetical protein
MLSEAWGFYEVAILLAKEGKEKENRDERRRGNEGKDRMGGD